MSFMLLGILNAQVSGGGAGAFDLLETQVLASSAASVTFTGLDAYSDYKHLQIRMVARSTNSIAGAGFTYCKINGDTGSNYSYHYLRGNGSVVSSGASTSQPTIGFRDTDVGTGSTADAYAGLVIDFLDFSNVSKNKTVRALGGVHVAGEQNIGLYSGAWDSTSAITSILFEPTSYSYIAGSRFSLYGVR